MRDKNHRHKTDHLHSMYLSFNLFCDLEFNNSIVYSRLFPSVVEMLPLSSSLH